MIPKDSKILREFLTKIGKVTTSRNFIKGAVIAADSEDNLKLMIDYMDSNPEASYADIMLYLEKQEMLT